MSPGGYDARPSVPRQLENHAIRGAKVLPFHVVVSRKRPKQLDTSAAKVGSRGSDVVYEEPNHDRRIRQLPLWSLGLRAKDLKSVSIRGVGNEEVPLLVLDLKAKHRDCELAHRPVLVGGNAAPANRQYVPRSRHER
jgi:hypothetical protein